MAELEEVRERSLLAAEFGIANAGRSLSCFLNVALQALWISPVVRMHILEFSETSESKLGAGV